MKWPYPKKNDPKIDPQNDSKLAFTQPLENDSKLAFTQPLENAFSQP